MNAWLTKGMGINNQLTLITIAFFIFSDVGS